MRSPCHPTSRGARGARSIGCWRLAEPLSLEEVRRALAEDRAADDVTSRLLGATARRPACAHFVAEGRFVVAGLPVVAQVYAELDRDARGEQGCPEGEWTAPGAGLAQGRAAAGALPPGGGGALNLLHGLSGGPQLRRPGGDAVW